MVSKSNDKFSKRHKEEKTEMEKTLGRGRQRLKLRSHKARKPTATGSWKKLGGILPQSIRAEWPRQHFDYGLCERIHFVVLVKTLILW